MVQFIISELREYLAEESPSLMFLYLITELCKIAGVDEDLEDNWIDLNKPIAPLKK